MRPGILILCCLVSVLLSCSEDPETQSNSSIGFFDLKEFFNSEAEAWTEATVMKTVSINGTEEKKQVDSLVMEEEFRVFKLADINKAALWDKYQVDSSFNGNLLEQVSYTALKPNLRTRSLELTYKEGELSAIHIVRKGQNILFSADQELQYQKDREYSIRTLQKVRFFKDNDTRVLVQKVN